MAEKMNRKDAVKTALIIALVFLGAGGWFLHLRIHPPTAHAYNLIPFISGLITIFFLPILFWFRQTVELAYIINGFSVIIGTIIMAYFSLTHLPDPITPAGIILDTLLADIGVLWAKFAIGKALFNLEFLKSETDMVPKGRFFRYPNMGWWWAHLVALATVFSLGNILWR